MRALILAAFLTGCGSAPEVSLVQCITPLGMETDLDCAAITAHERVVAETTKLDTSRLRGWKIRLHSQTFWSDEYQREVFTMPGKRGVYWGWYDSGSRTVYVADENFSSGALAHEMCHAMGVVDHGLWAQYGCSDTERAVTERLTPGAGDVFAGPHEGEWLAEDKHLHAGVSFGLTLAGHGIATEKNWSPAARFAVTTATVLAVGLAKETLDQFDYGGFSRRDLVADLVGVAIGHAVYALGSWALSLADGSVAHGVPLTE